MNKTTIWTGQRIRELREELKLSRLEFSQLLSVSPSTIEKWEHKDALDKPIRMKYIPQLNELLLKLKDPKTAIGIGTMFLNPSLKSHSLLVKGLGGLVGLSHLVKTENLEKTIDILNELKELNEEEREKFLKILKKMAD